MTRHTSGERVRLALFVPFWIAFGRQSTVQLAEEAQGEMKVFGRHPARAGQTVGERLQAELEMFFVKC